MRKYLVLGLTAVVLFSIILLAQDVDVTGDWEMTMETRRGETTRTISFVQEGEKLTVTLCSGGREADCYYGRLPGRGYYGRRDY
jgi:hypothetical protein